ncbi:glycosyltransferase family 2 protein [Gloeobacter kilaueensis]|uniref:Glycosyl transferase family 2 n=1 Tax=Gloeobacter kilaueensis (strain ATCC BAA-2537 / CCAP 1431/1 / ULC 316 / JS1) TaxID=1183438 RepID=U5QG08_GLOK1|nr:glycosyltransferase family 2 protein [Gloeobacter kilaueensis]AGY57846.1 glycosyl transferase family 2 [Gloeobacter kilaueensis JS1]
MDSAFVSVIVVNWNGERYLSRCIDSILNQDYRNLEIIVVDNASSDDSLYILQKYPQILLIQNHENLGFARANNQGFEIASGQYLFALNNDAFLSKNYISLMVDALSRYSNVASAIGKILRAEDNSTIDTTGLFMTRFLRTKDRGYSAKDHGQFDANNITSRAIFSVCGCAAFYRSAAVRQVSNGYQIFDSSFFSYYEDIDLGWRLQNAGWDSIYIPEAVAYHVRGGSEAAVFFKKSQFYQFHTLKNRYFTIIKNISFYEFIIFLPVLIFTESGLLLLILTKYPHLLAVYRAVAEHLPHLLQLRKSLSKLRTRHLALLKY